MEAACLRQTLNSSMANPAWKCADSRHSMCPGTTCYGESMMDGKTVNGTVSGYQTSERVEAHHDSGPEK